MSRCCGVRLHERTEQFRETLRRNADAGIAHGKVKLPRCGGILRVLRSGDDLDGCDDLAAIREFHRVADEIHHDLTKTCDIAEDIHGHAVFDLIDEINLLLARFRAEQIESFLDAVAEIHGLMFELQLAGFDLREVENVVDDREQGFRAGIDRVHVTALIGGERCFENQTGH